MGKRQPAEFVDVFAGTPIHLCRDALRTPLAESHMTDVDHDDRYLKGIENGWENTSRVRLSVLDPGGVDEINRPEKEFPRSPWTSPPTQSKYRVTGP